MMSDLLTADHFRKSAEHQRRAHAVMPGGAHTYAKGDDQFPAGMCPVVVRGNGAHVTDLDGNDLIEYGAGVRSVTLGHGYQPVCDAAIEALRGGLNFARPSVYELQAVEKMRELLPHAEMIKFGKNGSDCVTAAVKIARAYTGRDQVVVCGDHPFFSVDDWFIGTTPMNAGIPPAHAALTLKFKYNDLASVQALFDAYPNQIACVVTEAETTEPMKPRFIHDLQELCHRHGALMILDETITGFRWHLNAAQGMYDFAPDLSTFGKGMANGFSVSALCGKREYMRLLGTEDKERERVFAMSLTHGGETSGLAACIATINAYQNQDVIGTLYRQGDKLRAGVQAVINDLRVGEHFQIMGRSCLLFFATMDEKKQRSQPFRTLFLQEMLKRRHITPSLVVSAAHGDAEINQTIDAVRGALDVYRRALHEGVEKYLVGRPVQPVFRKFN